MKNSIIIIIVLLIFSNMLYSQLKEISSPNVLSEAKIYMDNDNTIYSKLITVQFSKEIIKLPLGKISANIDDISDNNIKSYFYSLEHKYGKINLEKVIPYAVWGNNYRINKRTKKRVLIEDISQIYRIKFKKNVPIYPIIHEIKKIPFIKHAEGPLRIVLSKTPNDPYYINDDNQWNLDVIIAEKAWDITTGSSNIKVSINDDFDWDANGNIHNDVNDKIDYFSKYHIINNYPYSAGHGRSVSGVVGAETNNNIGIASLGWNIRLLYNDMSTAYDSLNIINSIYKAVDSLDADVINFSWIALVDTTGQNPNYLSSSEFYFLRQAIKYALQQGVICVASAGNDMSVDPFFLNNNIGHVVYPAAFCFGDTGQVIAVSATKMYNGSETYVRYGNNDFLWNFSPGSDPINDPINSFIDVAAPGVNIKVLSEYGNDYYHPNGTSFSSPLVAALVAIIFSINDKLIPTDIYNIITSTTDLKSSNGWNEYLGYGRINAYKALKYTIENYGATLGGIGDTVLFHQYITISSGDTLTIKPGTVVMFDADSSITLTINGTLLAEGNSSNSITFTSSAANPSTGDWTGIKIYGNASLKYCDIKYANYGVYANQSTPTIQNCQITNCTNPIYIYRSNSVSGQPSILNNTITGSGGGDGIHLYESSPDIRGNDITSFTNGIYCKSNSSPNLGSGGSQGNNDFINNYRGLKAYIDCNPFLGSGSSGGHNEFTSNHTYYIWAKKYCEIDAENNWWGTSPPSSSKFYDSQGSDIDYSPWLTSGSLQKIAPDNGETTISLSVSGDISNSGEISLKDKTDNAVDLYLSADYESARKNCTEIISSDPDSPSAFRALDLLWQIASKADNDYNLDNFKDYLITLTKNNDNKELYGYAKIIIAGFEGDNGLALLDEVIADYPGSFVGEAALFKEMMYYYHEKSDYASANKILDDLKTNYPESELVADGESMLKGVSQFNLKKDAVKENIIPEKYSLNGAYPNPFNPSTTIKYELLRQSAVTLEIYNIRGKKVKEFSYSSQNAGAHQLTWNGQNQYGSRVASGLYIIRFSAKSLEGQNELFNKCLKVIMIK